MPAIAQLGVAVTARVSNLLKGFARARKSLTRFAGNIKAIAGRIARFGSILGAIAAGGLALLVKQANTAIDSISKLSDRLGIATEDLTALQHTASIMGVDTEGMNKALEQMVRRLGEATRGMGETYDALSLLGLEADKLAKMPTADAFKEIITTIRELPSVAQRADAAYRMFGRQGVKMINIINLTDEAFQNLMAEADLLGLTFDRVSGAQVEAANDAFTRLKAVFTGLGRTLAIELAPIFSTVIEKIVEATKAGGGMGRIVTRAVGWVVQAIGTLADWLELTKAAWFAMKLVGVTVLKELTDGVNFLAERFFLLMEIVGIDAGRAFMDESKKAADFWAQSIADTEDALVQALANFEAGVNRAAAEQLFKEITAAAEDAAEAAAKAAEETNKIGEAADWDAMFKALREGGRVGKTAARSMSFGAGAVSPLIRPVPGVSMGRETINVRGMDELVRSNAAIERQTADLTPRAS